MSNQEEQKPEQQAEAAPYERAVRDEDGTKWAEMQEGLIKNYKHIVVLRGAGTNNGIDKAAANKLVDEQLIPRVQKLMEDGPVALMFDGDEDSLQKPDVGFIMGRLRDAFGSETEDKITFVAAQKQSWYYPPQKEGNLANASGKEYKTTVFPDGKFEGDHNSFTQSKELANTDGYEQWYIGASGPIASKQLEDLDKKVTDGKRKVIMFRAPINEDLAGSVEKKLNDARDAVEANTDEANAEVLAKKVAMLEDVVLQRTHKFGIHYDDDGIFNVDTSKFSNLKFEVVG